MFSPISNKVSFPTLENTILDFWKKSDAFAQSIARRKDSPSYVFYDGPPFATGLPHHGHLLAGTIKDIIPRYQTMRGHYVERRFGWDCHGLPIEMEMQKQLKLEKHSDILKYGIGKFNEECRKIVLRYANQWRGTVERLGRWVDFDNDYKTMNVEFMESVWWVFHTLYKKGLIYEGYKVVPYSWAAGTILSNFEANLGYKATNDPSIVVKFLQKQDPSAETPHSNGSDVYFLAWTTTPWTLVGNLALCVNPNHRYVKVHDQADGCCYILGEKPFARYFDKAKHPVLESYTGKQLAGMHYQPVLPYASTAMEKTGTAKNINRVLVDDFVEDEEGTGIVQMAPVYGEEDFRVGEENGLPHYDPIDEDGNFQQQIDFIAGKNMKAADSIIIRRLRADGKIFREDTISHSYPFCWRTDTPLMYKAISTWFVNVEKIKKTLLDENALVHWVPNHIKNGRFGKWLEGARDWAISRNRFWGTPIPIWKAKDGSILCIGSIDELQKLSGEKVTDLHKHFVDRITIEYQGKTYTRIHEVLDCWFESGSMPYAASHYPFENQQWFEKNFPANFIAEGLDQTRGWFYTLIVIGVGLFDKTPFKNVIVNGLILAEDGKKMSKRLKNYPEPQEVLKAYGADALRIYMISSPVMRGETLRFSENGIKNVVKTIMLPLWNAFSFFTTYANIDRWDERQQVLELDSIGNKLDRWIFSTFQTLIKDVNTAMDKYELYRAVPPIVDFIDKLTNIYIRRSRRRFWKSENDEEKHTAYLVLYTILKDLAKVIAPFAPFIAERLFQVLRGSQEPLSVHHCDYPKIEEVKIDVELEQEMKLANAIISLSRAARIEAGMRIRQPLSSIVVVCQLDSIVKVVMDNKAMIVEELNVKEVKIEKDENKFVVFSAKANFKTLGKKIGKRVKEVNTAIEKLSSSEVQEMMVKGGEIKLADNTAVAISTEDIDVRRAKKGDISLHREGDICVFVETALTPELKKEGIAREIVHAVQRQRKDANLNYTDRIALKMRASETLQKATNDFAEHIKQETLAKSIDLFPFIPVDKNSEQGWDEITIENEKAQFKIEIATL